MTADDWSLLATVAGFVGSLMLFYPGWRVSRELQTIERLRKVVEKSEGGENDPGPELVTILEARSGAWRPLEHWLLLGGIFFIASSFAMDLFFVKLPN